MRYEVEFKPEAKKDLKRLPKHDQRLVMSKVEMMQNDLAGNVKHLTNFTPEYRLRAGNYRVLFEIEGEKVVIYRVKDRKDAYE